MRKNLEMGIVVSESDGRESDVRIDVDRSETGEMFETSLHTPG